MQKRKLKLNILDIAIVVAIICAAATFVFRDTVHEAFTEPEIVTLELTAHASNADSSLIIDFQYRKAEFSVNGESALSDKVLISSVVVDSEAHEAVFTFTCSGYRKLGRYYTEDGVRLSVGDACRFTAGDKSVSCVIEGLNG